MTRRILKKHLRFPYEVGQVPSGRIVHVAAQHSADEGPTIWVENYGDDKTQTVIVVGTGHPVPDRCDFVGTAICADGQLVWHVYQAVDA